MKSFVLLSYDYPPNDGGISRLCSAAVLELHRRGREVSVLTLQAASVQGPSRPTLPTHEVPRDKGWRELATARYLRQAGRDACVITGVWNPEATVAMLVGVRDLVVMTHGNEVMPYPNGMGFAVKRALRRRVLGAARVVVCNSRYTEGLVRTIVPRTRTVVIPPGVDASRFADLVDAKAVREKLSLPADKRLVLSVSRMDAYKGHDTVLRALAALPHATREHLHYAVAGKGSHLRALQALARELGLESMVSWLGFVPEADLPGLYGSADLFVLCTREDPAARGVEGFGMVFLEAQAAGLPVVGTRAGGIPDAIAHGNGGWLIEQNDADALRGLLEQLATDIKPFQEQGERGRRRARTEGSWTQYVNELLKVVDDEQA